MSDQNRPQPRDRNRRRGVRLTVVILALTALAVYGFFIARGVLG